MLIQTGSFENKHLDVIFGHWSYPKLAASCIGLAKTIYIWCIYIISGMNITKYTVLYDACIQFWPTLLLQHHT